MNMFCKPCNLYIPFFLDRFVPRDDAKRRGCDVQRESLTLFAMTRSDDGSGSQKRRRSRVWARDEGWGCECVVKGESENDGHCVRERQNPTGVGARAWPKWEGRLPKRRTKCLTLTERRLSFTFAEGTPRPEGQAFRSAVRWAIHFGLDPLVPSHQGEGTVKRRKKRPGKSQGAFVLFKGCPYSFTNFKVLTPLADFTVTKYMPLFNASRLSVVSPLACWL